MRYGHFLGMQYPPPRARVPRGTGICHLKLADALKPDQLHRVLDRYARQCCPVEKAFGQRYHWSLMQTEYSTDLVFRSQEALAPLYEQLSREAVLAVKAEQVAMFLGKKITPQLA